MAADLEGTRGLDDRVCIDETQIHSLRGGEDLEGRAEFIDALHRTVEERAVRWIAGYRRAGTSVGIEIGQRRDRDHLPRLNIHKHRAGALGIHQRHASGQHALGRGLHRQIKRESQRPRSVGRVAKVAVKLLFDAGHTDHFGGCHAFLAVLRPAHDMRGELAIGVKPHFARPKEQPRIADVMHRLLLFWRNPLLDPAELALAREELKQLFFFEIGEDLDQFPRRMFGVDQVRRLNIEGMRFEIRRQNAAMTVHDIGPLLRDRGAGRACNGFDGLRRRDMPHAHTDHREGAEKEHRQHQKPPFGPNAGAVTHLFMTQTNVLAFDRVRVLARVAGRKDAGKRAQGYPAHGSCRSSKFETSTAVPLAKMSPFCG